MKKILFLFIILVFGSITLAESNNTLPAIPQLNQPQDETNVQEDNEPKPEEKSTENTKAGDNLPKPDYTTVIKGSQIFYYDKEGKFFARDKKINEQTFFYNKTGQLTGKSVVRGEKTYYYNALNKFLGVCDEKECYDSDMLSTGKIPPLPKIKNFVPYINPDISNPKQEEKKSEEE